MGPSGGRGGSGELFSPNVDAPADRLTQHTDRTIQSHSYDAVSRSSSRTCSPSSTGPSFPRWQATSMRLDGQDSRDCLHVSRQGSSPSSGTTRCTNGSTRRPDACRKSWHRPWGWLGAGKWRRSRCDWLGRTLHQRCTGQLPRCWEACGRRPTTPTKPPLSASSNANAFDEEETFPRDTGRRPNQNGPGVA